MCFSGERRTCFVDTESAASRERPCINGLAEIRTSSPSFMRSADNPWIVAQSTDPYFWQRNPWIVPIHSLCTTYCGGQMMEKASQIDFTFNAYSVAPYQLDVYS